MVRIIYHFVWYVYYTHKGTKLYIFYNFSPPYYLTHVAIYLELLDNCIEVKTKTNITLIVSVLSLIKKLFKRVNIFIYLIY